MKSDNYLGEKNTIPQTVVEIYYLPPQKLLF